MLRFAPNDAMYAICIGAKTNKNRDCLTRSADPAYTRIVMNQLAKRVGRKVIVGLMSSIFLIVAGGATLTVYTAHAYAGTCSQLGGFPGLLQKMGFVTTGTCVTKVGGTVCGGGGACTISGNPGTCKNTAAINQIPVCTCVPKTVSK